MKQTHLSIRLEATPRFANYSSNSKGRAGHARDDSIQRVYLRLPKEACLLCLQLHLECTASGRIEFLVLVSPDGISRSRSKIRTIRFEIVSAPRHPELQRIHTVGHMAVATQITIILIQTIGTDFSHSCSFFIQNVILGHSVISRHVMPCLL